MKLDLFDTSFYGEWCSENELEYEVYYWFEKSSFQFFYTKKLIEMFGYKDYNEIESCGHFIPVFKTDVVALKKEFVANLHNKEVEDEIQAIIDSGNRGCSSGYDIAFKIFGEEHPTLWGEYYDFERGRLLKDAEKWCKDNNIPYYSPYDKELCVDLASVSLWANGFFNLNDTSTLHIWLAKENFRFVDLSDLKVNYGYKNCNDILASGEFVPLFKKDSLALRKGYIESLGDNAIEKEIDAIRKQNNNCSYENAFFMWILDKEREDDWRHYEKEQGLKMAKQWCIENNIPYYISKDKPDHLGSQFAK